MEITESQHCFDATSALQGSVVFLVLLTFHRKIYTRNDSGRGTWGKTIKDLQ